MNRAARSGAIALFVLFVPGALLLTIVLAPIMFAVLFAAELWWHEDVSKAWHEAVSIVTPDRWS